MGTVYIQYHFFYSWKDSLAAASEKGNSWVARNKKADKRIFTCVALQISHFQCTVSPVIFEDKHKR